MKFLVANRSINKATIAQLPYKLEEKGVGPFCMYFDDINEIRQFSDHYSITDGYIRDLNKKIDDLSGQEENIIKEISRSWPLPFNITGSFSSVLIEKDLDEVIICNDLIGLYPLYYLQIDNDLFISNSIILLGTVSGVEFDEAGIIQRCLGPDFNNIGSRTILKNCKRLLPGEYIKFNKRGNILEKHFDNTLFQDIKRPFKNPDLPNEFWQLFTKEVSYCLNNSKITNIALSGGIDSRVVLGAIPKDKKITCFTYGNENNYETKIASRLAKTKRAKFENFFEPELFFPPKEILKKYTLQSEALYLCSWLELLENRKGKKNSPFLLGDLTTTLTGRTIKKFSSKKFRKANFFKYYVLNKDYLFENSSKDVFEKWKKDTIKSYERLYTVSRLSKFKITSNRETLVEALHSDLNELFTRIEKHNLPFVELYDELFSWYTHNRMQVGKQILICNSHYKCYCPSMSMSVLRMASNIHPNLRLNFRFIKRLFTLNSEMKNLFSIPTSQAPLVPQNFPDFIKFPIWGLRSQIDQFLIRRMIKSRDINKRYRLFTSTNWAKIYQNPSMEKNMKDYFENNNLGEGYFNDLLNQAVQIKNLEQWPFANLEIINASSLNTEIDIIKTYKHSNEF